MNFRQGISDLPFILYELGVQYAVISPGSRNAPLILSLTQHNNITCFSVPDERSAGFIALGLARTSGSPVILSCTSGTAALNFAPALAEAYYQEVPLIALTADRPEEWIDQNDGQTIRQQHVFRNFIKKSFQLPEETIHKIDLLRTHRTLSNAVNLSLQTPPGPVHINIPLRVPLYSKIQPPSDKLHISRLNEVNQDFQLPDELSFLWNSCTKKMIVVGFHDPNSEMLYHLTELSKRQDVVILAENLSNQANENYISCHDRFLFSLHKEEKEEYLPEIIVTIGGAILSKQLKMFLRAANSVQHWHVDSAGRPVDNYLALSQIISTSAGSFLKALSSQTKQQTSSYAGRCLKRENHIRNTHARLLKDFPAGDLTVFGILLEQLPPQSVVHIGNSSAIRYTQYFDTRSDIEYYGNRGVSGIDGCLSTAVGCTLGTKSIVTAIIGDISFLYDSNALFNNHIPGNLKIIVINNGGGDIFRILDTKGLINKVEEYFTTPVKVDMSALCQAYGISYFRCDIKKSVIKSIKNMYKEPKTALLEIITSDVNNAKLLHDYLTKIKETSYE